MGSSNQTGGPVGRRCHRCGADIGGVERIGRRDACLQCGADLHCCLNCSFYDATYHNHCREPQAERQVEKERGNFCEWFSLGGKRAAVAGDARARLEALFGKKT